MSVLGKSAQEFFPTSGHASASLAISVTSLTDNNLLSILASTDSVDLGKLIRPRVSLRA